MLNRISNIAIIALIIGIILEMFYPVFSYLTLSASTILYVCILLKNKRANGKINKLVGTVCSLSLVWIFLREFSTSPYVAWLGFFILLLQGYMVYKILDPILEMIALQRRLKREREQITNE